MNRKILLTALSALAIITVLIVPVFAAPLNTLTPHAAIEGMAIVRTGRGRPVFDRDEVLTFWAYTPSGEVAGHEDPGFAVTLEVDGTLYAWHVTT